MSTPSASVAVWKATSLLPLATMGVVVKKGKPWTSKMVVSPTAARLTVGMSLSATATVAS